MKAVSTEAKTTDTDPAVALGASVLVGGVKPGRLRYIGGVHFVAGQWCGIELDDADGLHDGVVDGVRYFTCRDGHGIFAPRHRVTLRSRGRSPAPVGSPDVRIRELRKPTVNVPSSSAEDGDVDRLFRISSPQHRHQSSLDGRDMDFSSKLKLGTGRPQSAILTDDDLDATAESSHKRSSLVSGRVVSSNTPRSSPKRVTFFDEIINSKERGVPSMRTDVRQRGHEYVDDDNRVAGSCARIDTGNARTLAYDFDEGSPSRKTSRTDGNRPSSYAHRAYVDDSDLNNPQLNLQITGMTTSNPEMLLSSDSIEESEIDGDFAAYGLTSITRTRIADAQNVTLETSSSKSPKARVDEALSDLEFMAGRPQNKSLDYSNKQSSSGTHVTAGDSTSSAARASFELARTALTQYADLVRAAQESTAARRSWTPPAVRRQLPTPVATSSSAANRCAFDREPAPPLAKVRGDDNRPARSPEPATLDGGSGSGSADEVDFETFDGEELDSIGDAMIDSIDGSSVQSEDSIAMLPHLSDVDDDDDDEMVECGRSVDDKGNQVISDEVSVTASDDLTSTTRDHDNGNEVDYEGNNSNSVVDVDVNLLNKFNNAVTCRQLAFSDTQMYPDISGISATEESLVVAIADSDVAVMTTGIANIDYFLRQSTTIRDERPMSLISNSSSTDTGCVLDIESDAMVSSGSVLMSSGGGSDDIMDESWLQQQLDVDDRPPDTEISPYPPPALNHCPLDAGNCSKTAFVSCQGDDVSKASGNTDSAATCDPATGSTTSVIESSYTDQSDSGLLLQATLVNCEPLEPAAEEGFTITNEASDQIQVSATPVQSSDELVNNENVQSAVEESVLTSESEPQPPAADATEPDADLVDHGHASDEIQNASNIDVDEERTLSVDVDRCQLSQFQSVEPPLQTESSADISLNDAEDVKQTATSETVASSVVSAKIQRTDTKNIENEKTASKQRLQSNSKRKTSSKKETESSSSKPAVATADKCETDGSRSTTPNPRSTSAGALTTSKERKSRDPVNTEQLSNKNALEKSKLKPEKDDGQQDADTKPSPKSSLSSQKASDRTTSSAATRRRDATERPSNPTNKPKKDAAANASTTEAGKTPDSIETKNSLSTAASGTRRITAKRNELQNAEDLEKTAGGKRRETASKVNNNQTNGTAESRSQTSSVSNAGKKTSLPARKSSVARSNPGPEDGDKDPETRRRETRTTTGKQRMKSTGLNPPVDDPVSGATAEADRPADKMPKDPSITTGNPGNPRSIGDRATTSGESTDSSLPTKKPQQERRLASSRATATTTTAVDRSVPTSVAGRGATQTAKSTPSAQRADRSSDTAAADTKAPKSSVRTKAKSSTQVDAESTVGQRRRPNGDSSKAKPATSTAAADRQRSSTVTKTASATSAATKRTTRKPASLADQLAETKEQLSSALQELEQRNSEKDTLQKSVDTLREERSSETDKLKEELKQKLQSAADQYETKLQAEINKVINQHSHEVNTLRLYHERQLGDVRREYENAAKASQEEHTATVARLEASHAAAVTALNNERERQLNEITERFEAIKHSLSDTVEQLRVRCDELSAREQMYAASWKKDTDVRQQMALEVNSIQVVLDQKNDEIRRLRQHQSELETKLEEIPTLMATISKHQQQTENLEAIVSIKTDHERQLAEMHQHLLKKFERESKAMKRLSMNNDELMWKLMSQSDVGPLDDDDGTGDRATTSREAAGGMFMSATLPSRGCRGTAGSRAMSRSYDSPRAMFGPSASGIRQRGAKATSTKQREESTTVSAKTKTDSENTSDSANGRLRRSGTYDVVDND